MGGAGTDRWLTRIGWSTRRLSSRLQRLGIELTPDVSAWALGSGESAVLCLAAQSGAVAILDDRDARRAAKTMGLNVLGMLGVIIRARAEGRIPSAGPLLKALQRQGLRLDNGLVAKALRDAFGEVWEP